MAKTNKGLVEYVKAKVGCYYWFGCFGQMASKALYTSKKKQYPKYYTAKDFEKQIANPKQVFDCAGLPKAYLWTDSVDDTTPVYKLSQDLGANGLYNSATEKGAIGSMPELPGILVFKGTDKKKTHVGVFVGDNTVIEAKGHAYGVIQSRFSTGGWKYWGKCPYISYEFVPVLTPAPTSATYKINTKKDPLRLRAEPNTNSKVLTLMTKGAKITVTTTQNGWAKTTYKGKTGYCSMKYLQKI